MEKHGEEKAVLNADIGSILIFRQNVWSTAYDVIWSASMKLPGPRAFRPVVMAAVAVVIVSFFTTIIIAMRHDSLRGLGGSLGGSMQSDGRVEL